MYQTFSTQHPAPSLVPLPRGSSPLPKSRSFGGQGCPQSRRPCPGALLAALPMHLLEDTGELLGSLAPMQHLKALCRGMVGHRVERGLSIALLACPAAGKSVGPPWIPWCSPRCGGLRHSRFGRPSLGRTPGPSLAEAGLLQHRRCRRPGTPRASCAAWGGCSQHRAFRTAIPRNVEQNVCEKGAEPEKGREGLFIARQLR